MSSEPPPPPPPSGQPDDAPATTGRSRSALGGLEVVVTGRLQSMTKEEALAALRKAGARCRDLPTETTALLVLGDGGCPLRADGRPTRALQRAEQLRANGAQLRTIDEAELLAQLDPEHAARLAPLHTTARLARMLDVPGARVREWTRAGLLRATHSIRKLHYFDFREVARARQLLELTSAGVTVARIKKSLRQLRTWLPGADRSLHQLEALSRRSVVVRLADGRAVEPSGQLRLEFAQPPAPAPSAAARPLPQVSPADADGWCAVAERAEADQRFEDAAEAYHQALMAAGPDAELAFNLGNVLHALDRTGEALQRYLQAVELEPAYAEAWNNAGNAMAELARHERATQAYQRALQHAPDYADVHYNLAESLLALGDTTGACTHWRQYLHGEQDGPWATHARQQLARHEPAD